MTQLTLPVPGRMHAASVEQSARLQRVLAVLETAGPAGVTSRELRDQADVCAPATYVSELRANGYRITCAYEGISQAGARVYRYRLEGDSNGHLE
jgi:hypothetical protein